MKTTTTRFFFSLALCASASSLVGEQGSYTSEPRDDLRMTVAGIAQLTQSKRGGIKIPRSNEMLLFGVRTVTNMDSIIGWPKKPEYLCTAELSDAAGQTVPRTKMGRLYGSKYPDFDISKAALVRQHTNPSSGPCWNLFRPADLFDITKPGTYTLRVQFQVMKVETDKTAGQARIVKFPALSLPILHEKR
jgi:hypothetical protein